MEKLFIKRKLDSPSFAAACHAVAFFLPNELGWAEWKPGAAWSVTASSYVLRGLGGVGSKILYTAVQQVALACGLQSQLLSTAP
jgi:hypothetical protein